MIIACSGLRAAMQHDNERRSFDLFLRKIKFRLQRARGWSQTRSAAKEGPTSRSLDLYILFRPQSRKASDRI